jgi:hypothetical protein
MDSREELTPAAVERAPPAYTPPAIHWEEEFEVVTAATGCLNPPDKKHCAPVVPV